MRRLLLVGAMLLSLWPVGAVAAVALTDSGSDQASSGDVSSTDDTASGDSGASVSDTVKPDCAKLAKLVAREHHLLTLMERTTPRPGVEVPRVAEPAASLAADLKAWEFVNRPLATGRLMRFAQARYKLALALSRFAYDPSSTGADHLNAAIRGASSANRFAGSCDR